ncbi:MAG TPA: four helix bundle protein [Planctomycetota bacterium]|nr:four helix bundle protein [Planctomycetota bacterium]
MRDFRKLDVWLKAHKLTLRIYNATNSFPPSELYGLVTQLRRAAVSIEANLAEGCGRTGDIDKRMFVFIACGSASELECLLQIARDLNFLTDAVHRELSGLAVEIRRMLYSFGATLGARGSRLKADG